MPTPPKPTPINPDKTYAVASTSGNRLSPNFFHMELANYCQRAMKKDLGITGLTIVELPNKSVGDMIDALEILTREQRWLEMAIHQKASFSALCEGWSRNASLIVSRRRTNEEWKSMTEEEQKSELEKVLNIAFEFDEASARAICIDHLRAAGVLAYENVVARKAPSASEHTATGAT